MKTYNQYIKWNNNNPTSIKQAERKKTMYENKGYTLKHTFVNSISGECTLTYEVQQEERFTPTESIQIEEIRRRIREFKKGDKNAPMIYLGLPSEVKTLKQKGIIVPYSKETKRHLNWYNLTEYGKTII